METSKVEFVQPAIKADGTMEGGRIDIAYVPLWNALMLAFHQASEGKGKERHVFKNAAFRDQQIFEIAEKVGTGFLTGQAVKKLYEKHPLTKDKIRDLLGAVVYTSAAVILLQEQLQIETDQQAGDLHESSN